MLIVVLSTGGEPRLFGDHDTTTSGDDRLYSKQESHTAMTQRVYNFTTRPSGPTIATDERMSNVFRVVGVISM